MQWKILTADPNLRLKANSREALEPGYVVFRNNASGWRQDRPLAMGDHRNSTLIPMVNMEDPTGNSLSSRRLVIRHTKAAGLAAQSR